ncbi:MAG: Mrp/NBP35 family ATP-binding protein [Puniceicoccales bacterium]|jgi:ATP-binding protein involved in chromosome partitioning|nr:Mrp/NBP35 family ATP-binding protein [Puniceicoccales bacterium]
MDKDAILRVLKQVKYPGFSRDIVSFGLVREVSVADDGKGTVVLGVSTSATGVRDELRTGVSAALANAGLSGVEIVLVDAPPATAPAGATAPTPPAALPGVKYVVAVGSGKGGVGKTTVAVNLACALAKEFGAGRVGLLDCDFYGPSVPLMLGLGGVHEVELAAGGSGLVPVERFGVKVMSLGFFIEEGAPVIWRGPMVMKTVQQFSSNVEWGGLDVLVVDLPPGTGDAQLSLVQAVAVNGVVIVTTPQAVAAGVARRGGEFFTRVGVRVLGVVENMSGGASVFGSGGGASVASALGTELLGSVPLDVAVCEGGDSGVPVFTTGGVAGEVFGKIARGVIQGLHCEGGAV